MNGGGAGYTPRGRRMGALALPALALPALVLLAGCGETAPPPGGPAAGTREMAARLIALADSADPLLDEQLNTARLRHITNLAPTADGAQMLVRAANAARELLHAGHTRPALEQLLFVDRTLEGIPAEPFPGLRRSIEELIGVAFLRLGAELACPAGGPAAGSVEATLERSPCWPAVPPAAPAAVSDSARAALNAAVGWHLSLLRLRPDDLRARWLLNLAAMTAGSWPDSVPPPYRLTAAEVGGSGEFPAFEDVAPRAGLDAVSLSGGAIVDDLNGDGLPDVMTSSRGLLHQLRYFESDGTGGFADRTAEAGLEGLLGGLNLIHADYDNDGDADVFVLRGGWLVQPYPQLAPPQRRGRLLRRDARGRTPLRAPDPDRRVGRLRRRRPARPLHRERVAGQRDAPAANSTGAGKTGPSRRWPRRSASTSPTS